MTHQSGSVAGLNATSAAVAASPLSSTPQRFPAHLGRITAIQASMARAALGRTQGEVANGSGCSIKTVLAMESNPETVSRKNANVIRRYYEDLGVFFIADAYGHVVKVAK